MSTWRVLLTPEFKQEIRDIHSYIANTLLAPETAKKQVLRILDAVGELNEMPFRYPLHAKEPWLSRGLRKLTVDNFTVFYYPNKDTSEVAVFHVFYGGRDIGLLLSKEPEIK